MFEKIEILAVELLGQFGYMEAPIPIKKLIKNLGIEIKPEYLGDEISGLLVIEDKRTIIGYNSSEPTVRQRFTLAHELGHHILHRSESSNEKLFVDKIMYRKNFTSKKEKKQEMEANVFASRILMPENLVKSEFNKILDSLDHLTEEDIINRMASIFKVSSISMTYRLSNLNLLENRVH
ncbi:ImmA/IrrE family metallo-endopeptidase [Salegentibacter sp. JZCK2]|uniref:ImmA/IrrE family metallo-endopeptidase n=1 Tax=Salegentibacter tibetensis TaxID=2873600 RepID=UPI001CCCF7D1|nr:ImmA/IrrE family metallo-endopeptidase [Salegentibacter tibetensis]MBZ9731186.1 ImmA/IrrE family metallo-endopeptidase [Salegentibacter tibetensis]